MKVFTGPAELLAVQGERLGASEWLTLDQERIDRFAEATGDHQWIHVDRARAADGPFGTTIAHGYLTLSLIPALVREIFRVEGATMAINYGLDRVRFIAPVPAGARLRAVTELLRVEEVPGGAQATFRTTVEIEGGDKPACVAEHVNRYAFAAGDQR